MIRYTVHHGADGSISSMEVAIESGDYATRRGLVFDIYPTHTVVVSRNAAMAIVAEHTNYGGLTIRQLEPIANAMSPIPDPMPQAPR